MITILVVIAGLIYGIFLVQLLCASLYILQIKEYRLDRTWSQVREERFGPLIRRNFLRRPAVTIRNILSLIAAFTLVIVSMGIIVYYMQLWQIWNTYTIVLLAVLMPFGMIKVAVLGVLITEPLARYKRRAVIAQARRLTEGSKTIFIGISGTYGKSTTKEYLAHILSTKFRVGKTDANMNTDIGVAMSILKNLKPDTEYFIAEVGAYKKGEVLKAASIFHPSIVILTPFGNQHMSIYGSHDNLVAAESEILDLQSPEDVAYVCYDIPEYEYVKKRVRGRLHSYSIHQKADTYATDIAATKQGTHAVVYLKGEEHVISSRLIGEHVIQNLLPAVAIAQSAGMSATEIMQSVSTIEPVVGKLSIHPGPRGCAVLNDSSNSTLHGFLAAIEAIRLLERDHIYILSKGIIELGHEKHSSYKRIVEQIEKYKMNLLTTDKSFKSFEQSEYVTILRREEDMYIHIASRCDTDTAILLEGRFTPDFVKKFI